MILDKSRITGDDLVSVILRDCEGGINAATFIVEQYADAPRVATLVGMKNLIAAHVYYLNHHYEAVRYSDSV